MPKLEDLAAHVGYARHHFHRLFKRTTGVTPASYARKLRSDRLAAALTDGARVTAAVYKLGRAHVKTPATYPHPVSRTRVKMKTQHRKTERTHGRTRHIRSPYRRR